MSNDRLVTELKNIGTTVAQRLQEIGITTQADLKAVGAVEAFRQVRERNPSVTTPVCYYLYSLEGALRNRHWDDLPLRVKKTLREQAGVG